MLGLIREERESAVIVKDGQSLHTNRRDRPRDPLIRTNVAVSASDEARALSYDHRIIDGKESVSFLKMVKENLEDPRRLFLNI